MLRKFLKSEFSKNVATLMSGTLIGQAIPFFATFFLTRIFTPEDFGVFAIYFSLVNILGTVSTGRYEMAILLPKTNELAFDLVKIALIICGLFSVLILLLISIFYNFIFRLSENMVFMNYIYYLPLSIFGFGVYKIFGVWYTRVKEYKKISMSIVVKSIIGIIFNIGIGYFFGLIGLFLGNVFSSFIAVLVLNPLTIFNYHFKKRRFLILVRKYWKFPVFDIPSSFIYAVSKNGIILLISKGFSAVITGLYSLTERLLISPTQVFVGSYTQVYNQQITHKYNKGEDISFFAHNNMIKISKILFIPFILGTYLSTYLIPILLGDGWGELYMYIYLLSPLIFFTMVLNPLGYVLKIKDKQDISFIQHLILTSVKLGSLSISIFVFHLDIYQTLLIYAILSILALSYNTNMIFNILKLQFKSRLFIFLISLLCVVVTIFNYFLI